MIILNDNSNNFHVFESDDTTRFVGKSYGGVGNLLNYGGVGNLLN